ncbi:nitroreductase family protein [Candidatus Synechococcus calcipolaris G9]|uniref:Nitroreductase family protein n=1 Tax=Candidatus Synechococcus calcipolaris G9 TaxID=1497997 RepID=A0ABT6EXZ0_9SYNE|nr:nitroreductase family protein [Candidatus Synechococcus calcipolaris]MDG2989958.1 nitroreductase family protein [Candidatus Synechococcus calcipolaris G9]
MEKLAPAHYPIQDLIQRRWSPLAFRDRPIPMTDLARLLEAARWSPSSYNEQPWVFLVAEKYINPTGFNKLLSCLVEANQVWAARAPVLMIGLAKNHFAHNNTVNRHAFYDLGAAVAYLTLQAMDLGIYVHQMAGFDPVKTREVAQVPSSHEPVVAIALGYYGELSSLPPNYQERERGPRNRNPLKDIAFRDTWGDSFPLP